MPAQRHERYGVWDNFVRGCYLVFCVFIDISLAGQVWVDTRATWGGWAAAATVGALAGLVFAEIILYRLLWRDVRVSVTEANVAPTIISDDGDPVRIEILVHNDGYLDARGLAVEAIVDGESVGTQRMDIPRDGIKSMTVEWGATKGEHELRIRVEPGSGKGRTGRFRRRTKGEEVFSGSFAIRRGRKVLKQKDILGVTGDGA
jgi:hypothetical protein